VFRVDDFIQGNAIDVSWTISTISSGAGLETGRRSGSETLVREIVPKLLRHITLTEPKNPVECRWFGFVKSEVNQEINVGSKN
jgi:hypothetical protein